MNQHDLRHPPTLVVDTVKHVLGHYEPMVGRRALVVGSQCDPKPHLIFLPKVAEDLAEVLGNPDLGAWGHVDLKRNPTHNELIQALDEAFKAAERDDEVLLVALIGHGMARGDDFYFLPRDAAATGSSGKDILLAQEVKERLYDHPNLNGLILLVDTCHAGHVVDASEAWERTNLPLYRSGHIVMTASSADAAFGGEFTKAVTKVLREGIPNSSPTMLPHTVIEEAKKDKAVAAQEPGHVHKGTNEHLWLAYNAAVRDGALIARPPQVADAVSHRSMRAYAIPQVVGPDDAVTALAFAERGRVQLDVLWGLDRGTFTGVVVDPRGCDLAADLNRVEKIVANAATHARVVIPFRHWVRLNAVRADGPADQSTIPDAPDDVSCMGFVLPVIVNERAWRLTESDWRRMLTGMLWPLRGKRSGVATILQVQATPVVDGVHAARRIAPVVRGLLGHDARVPFDVVSRLLPGEDEADLGQAWSQSMPAPARMLDLVVEAITTAQRRCRLMPTLTGAQAAGTPDSVPPVEIAAGVVARLAAGDRPRTSAGDELSIGGLLELARAFASPLWRELLRACARGLSGPAQAEVLLVATRLDGDLDTWLSARSTSAEPAPEDVPWAGHEVPDALVRAYHRLERPVPEWLTKRMSRQARAISPDWPNGVSSKDRAYWARLRTCEVSEVIGDLLTLSDEERCVVGLVADPEMALEHQVRMRVDDLRRLLRPSGETLTVS